MNYYINILQRVFACVRCCVFVSREIEIFEILLFEIFEILINYEPSAIS